MTASTCCATRSSVPRCSPGSFGHAGAHGQVGWADPASGISFAYLTNGVDADMMREGIRRNALASLAASLELD